MPDAEKTEKNPEYKSLEELKKSLDNREYSINRRSGVYAKSIISKFYSYSKNYANCGEAADYILDNKNDFNKRLVEFAQVLKDKSIDCRYNDFYNFLRNDESILSALIRITSLLGEYELKIINTINNAVEMSIPEWITVNISREDLKTIMVNYFYARQIRNRINHAADSESEPEEITEILCDFFKDYDGIDYSSFSMDDIKSQLRKSVEFVLSLSEKT